MRAAGVIAAQDREARAKRLGDERRRGGREDVGARGLHQRFDDRGMRRHERARDAGRLAERAHVDDALRREPEMGERSAARVVAFAQHAEAVRVVDDEPRVVLVGERAAAPGAARCRRPC